MNSVYQCRTSVALFEFVIGEHVGREALGNRYLKDESVLSACRNSINTFAAAGYDFATLPVWELDILKFEAGEHEERETISLNAGGVIEDEASFDAYAWPEEPTAPPAILDELSSYMPDGMKLVISANGGVLETVIKLVGYENLCFMSIDTPDLVQRVADSIGSRLLKYYQCCLEHDTVGAILLNDDWGFKSQTMVPPDDLRKYVFPWHKKIVEAAHAAERPALLHSCGQMLEVWDDIIDEIGFDGKHSYEDTIIPVEESYDRWGDRIAILGGIDMDFLCRSTPDEVYRRGKAMLERAGDKGGYALGSGNSVAEYVPVENFLAMTRAALD